MFSNGHCQTDPLRNDEDDGCREAGVRAVDPHCGVALRVLRDGVAPVRELAW